MAKRLRSEVLSPKAFFQILKVCFSAISALKQFLTQSQKPAIHFIQTSEAAFAELPHILAGHAPPEVSSPNNIGTHKYDKQPRAVIIGRGYSHEESEKIRTSCAGIAKEPVAWLIGDPSSPVVLPSLPADGRPLGPEYALKAAVLAKEALVKWLAGDASDGGGNVKDQVVFY